MSKRSRKIRSGSLLRVFNGTESFSLEGEEYEMRAAKLYTILAGAVVLLGLPAYASDELPPSPKLPSKESAIDLSAMMATLDKASEDLEAKNLDPVISEALKDARDEYNETVKERAKIVAVSKTPSSNPTTEAPLSLETLAAEVDQLRSKIIVEKSSLLALQTPKRVKVTGSKTVFNYLETAVYEVTSSVDHVTDIQLKAGESLTTAPTSGDTVRWSVGVMKSGAVPNETTHLIVKPLDDNIQTNLVIATDQHVYQLRLKSGSYHTPVVAWNYPEDTERALQEAVKREASQEITITPDALRFTYEIAPRSKYPWTPIRVFDDGKKTFIQMPKEMRTSEAPALFLIDDESEPLLANYRIKGDYYIVDRLFEKAELRVGPSKKVTIELEHPNWFERNFF
jgi:P-type conjugative transfer protein TrbG